MGEWVSGEKVSGGGWMGECYIETKGWCMWVSEAPEFLVMSPAVRGG